MPVSRLPLQRVYAGSTSLFEYPIGPFLLFRTLVLSSRRLDFSSTNISDLTESLQIISDFHAPITIFPSSCTLFCDYLFPLCTPSRLPVLCKLCIPALPHRIPGTSFHWVLLHRTISSTDYSLLVWSALWCTFMICMRLRNPFIRYPLL